MLNFSNFRWKSCLGVEPVMFLYMLAIMLTSVVEESFYIYKECKVNFGLPTEVCLNINEEKYSTYKKMIQVSVSSFFQWYTIVSQGIPVFLSVFLGAWSDRVGRKIPLLVGLFANFIFSVMMVVNSFMTSWRLEVILWTACLPCAIGGGNLTVFMASFSYLADTTTDENRTVRTTFLEVAYLLPMPIGVALGSLLFNKVFSQSYTWIFSIKAVILGLAIVYSILFLKRKTAEPGGSRLSSCWCGVLNWSYMVDSIITLIKVRPEKRRRILLLVIFCLGLYTFQRDESRMMYLYTQLRFSWDLETYSNFRSIQTALFVCGLFFGVPLMVKVFKLNDNTIIVIGAVCHIAGRVVFIIVGHGQLLYLGAVLATLGPVVAPILRSLTSKLVPASERGKAIAALSVADTCAPLLSTVVYSQVYNATVHSYPQAIFFVTCASQLIVLSIALYFMYILKGGCITQAYDDGEVTALPGPSLTLEETPSFIVGEVSNKHGFSFLPYNSYFSETLKLFQYGCFN